MRCNRFEAGTGSATFRGNQRRSPTPRVVAVCSACRVVNVTATWYSVAPRGRLAEAFGGAGGLHVCALADALGIRRALVPEHAGVLSALGMLVAPAGRTLVRAHVAALSGAEEQGVADALDALAEQGIAGLRAEGARPGSEQVVRSVDLRYLGQSYTLNLPWEGVAATLEAFHRAHLAAYGHRMDLQVEIVSLRVRVRAPATPLQLPELAGDTARSNGRPGSRGRSADGVEGGVPMYRRADLAGRGRVGGPAIVSDTVATTWVAQGWVADLDGLGNLWLTRQDESL